MKYIHLKLNSSCCLPNINTPHLPTKFQQLKKQPSSRPLSSRFHLSRRQLQTHLHIQIQKKNSGKRRSGLRCCLESGRESTSLSFAYVVAFKGYALPRAGVVAIKSFRTAMEYGRVTVRNKLSFQINPILPSIHTGNPTVQAVQTVHISFRENDKEGESE